MATASHPSGLVSTSLTVLALAVALALAACSSDSSESDPTTEPTAAATTATPEAPTEAGGGDGVDAETQAFFTRVAAAVAAQDGYRMTGSFDDPTTGSASMEGAIDQRTDPPSSQLTVDMEGQPTMQVRMVDDTTYVTGIPDMADDGTWLSIGPDDTIPLMGQALDSIRSMATTPDLQDLPEGTTVEGLGTDQIDGETYDHYRMTDATGRVQEAWLDGDLPRRIVGDDGGTIDYTDWGAAIDIEAPDPDDVRTISEIMGEFGGGGLPDGLPSDFPTDLLDDLPTDLLDGLPAELLSELPGG